MAIVRILMIGDVVGEPGLTVLERRLPGLIGEHSADFTVVNGENAAAGFGLNQECLKRILGAGADVITTGNHVWEKREFWPLLDKEERVLRPCNYPEGSAGHGWIRLQKSSLDYMVVNLQGREYMTAIDCPFRTFDRVMTGREEQPEFLASQDIRAAECGAFTLVDFHAESTREKEALGYYLDGRASMVAGTHTHVQTSDERVLPRGTGYITDLGMTGITDGVIGMDKAICLGRARNQVLYRMECAAGGISAVEGVLVELDQNSGRALNLRRIRSFAG
ncbi:MAG: YmdB family metallophosphoesterase [Treponema sp.]|nr:YmdB family metallophosphoesterase [Treponema sp.]